MHTRNNLSAEQLGLLFGRVFEIRHGDQRLAIMIDLPDGKFEDNPDWTWLRQTARQWRRDYPRRGDFALKGVDLLVYPATGNTNLPERVAVFNFDREPRHPQRLHYLQTEEILLRYDIVVAMTKFSITRQLQTLAPKLHFRGATMPGFTAAMVPALFLDYTEIGRRVNALKRLLEEAVLARVEFTVNNQAIKLDFDLRFNQAMASTGYYPNPGMVGNLPTGEAYIAPYLGLRHPDEPSRTCGLWPVMNPDGLTIFRVENGRIVGVLNEDTVSCRELQKFLDEPGLAWIAELGLGVVEGSGIEPVGGLLLDEKLIGIHVAFGESAHGGEVTSANFTDRNRADHVDVIYTNGQQICGTQILSAGIRPNLTLIFADDSERVIMRDGRYVDGVF